MYRYTPKFRPPHFSAIPKGYELLETPTDRNGINRPDLPTSRYRFGVIGYQEQLSADDKERFELMYLGQD